MFVLYRFDRVRKSYGPREVLREVTWQHNPGEKVGLVGRNGAGKTTLLRIALGREEPDAGEFVKANAVKIATVDQSLPGDLSESLHDYAAGAFAELHKIEAEMRRLEHAMADGDSSSVLHDRYDAISHRFENEGGYEMVAEVEKALSGLGFAPYDLAAPTPIRAAVVQAPHAAYQSLDLASIPGLELLLDGRNALDPDGVRAAGVAYAGIGR